MWVVNCLHAHSLEALKTSLRRAVNITQVSLVPFDDVRLGLCCVNAHPETGTELKFLLKIDEICLEGFYKATDQLRPSDARCNAQQLAAALKKIIDKIESDHKAVVAASENAGPRETVLKEIHVVSNMFEPDTTILKVLRFANKRNVQVHFHAFVDNVDSVRHISILLHFCSSVILGALHSTEAELNRRAARAVCKCYR